MEQLRPVHCFACDAVLQLAAGERVGFRDTCESCSADLHVCRNCAHHDPSAYNECRESNAERVSQRDRANRCDYFTPGEQQGGEVAREQASSRSKLDDLFKKP